MPIHTRLSLYNLALGHLGERKLILPTENVEARYLLDAEYDQAIAFCLRGGYWNFAMRAIKMDSDFTPNFGFLYGFTKPPDWVKTYQVGENERFDPPYTLEVEDQYGAWLAHSKTLYFRFVSTIKGFVESQFPPDYAAYVGFYLALQVMPRLTNKRQDEIAAFETRVRRAALNAQSNDAMDNGPEAIPVGSWVRARRGGWGSSRNCSSSGTVSS